MPKRVLVCGGRDFKDHSAMWLALDRIHEVDGISCLIHGGAVGADGLAHWWAVNAGVEVEVYPVSERAVATARNKQMLEEGEPDFVVVAPGGRRTHNMIAQSMRAGLQVWTLDEVLGRDPQEGRTEEISPEMRRRWDAHNRKRRRIAEEAGR